MFYLISATVLVGFWMPEEIMKLPWTVGVSRGQKTDPHRSLIQPCNTKYSQLTQDSNHTSPSRAERFHPKLLTLQAHANQPRSVEGRLLYFPTDTA